MTIKKRPCWACGSHRFIETVSREHCPACGIECDYWGKGANAAYDRASATRHAIEEREREAEFQRQLEEDF